MAKKETKEKVGDSASTKIREVASNRKAFHDYFIDEKMEAGIVLAGTEIKSVRGGRVNLRDSFARIDDKGELWLWNAHISPYERAGAFFQHTPTRNRKLLMHKNEIRRLATKTQAKGLTLVPLRMYLKKGKAKVELGLARGKHNYDKRDAMAERDANREIERTMRDRG
jgi:SsrA-binding protein